MNSSHGIAETSPLRYAGIAGVLYLFIIVAGIFNEAFVLDKLIVSGDATATVNNIRASELLYRIGISGTIIMLACAVAVALIFYVLLRPVSRPLALLATSFNLVSISVDLVGKLSLFTVLLFSGDAAYLQSFEPDQLHALAYVSLRVHSVGYNISLVFFGINCLIWGYLIFKSGYFPKTLGILMVICGICYIANSFAWFLAPAIAGGLFPAILLPCLVAEASLCLWLMVKGVRLEQWKQRAGSS